MPRISPLVFITALTFCGCTSGPEPAASGVAASQSPAPTAAQSVENDAVRAGNASSSTAHHTDGKVPEPTLDPLTATPSSSHTPSAGATPAADAKDTPRARPADVREITVPAGTTLNLQLNTPVSSASSAVEEAVQATLRRAVVINGTTVIPAGAAVSGYVTEAVRAGRVKGRARVGMRFTSLRVGDERYTIRTATVASEARATKKKDAAKIGIGAGAGAITGAIVGGGKGAAIGTAVGAGAGTGVVLATRGEEVSLPRGAIVSARLAESVVVRVH